MAKKREAEIQEQIRRVINESGRAWVYRQNSGVAKMGDRWVRFGIKGCGDLTGLTREGKRLEVEVKRPGCKQTKPQMEFQGTIEEFGGIYLVVSSVDDILERLDLGYLF